MNNLLSNLKSAIENKHVSVSVVLACGCELGQIWLPHYTAQFQATSKLLLGYAAIAAANSGPPQPQPPK